ncbi:type II toxin-antitoxin system HigB family toxin [Rhodanobacter sp. Root561]|uniref:type II toxin-antitoxin system HigB family toxin n=1 Tax=Rhodanobacter sp. Root561 TaxID=1736560 RepID=UPI0009E83E59|nr:type II toxin-antitoxin system HigB family toxin [Rhodanobacter sp. Root561]
MKIIGLGLLHNFIKQYPDTKNWIDNWTADSRRAQWKTSHDIRKRYASASFLAKNVVIFNIRGNNYRLETVVAYNTGTVLIEWIGTHAEYTRRHK